jgi:diguanylate cyclase (GGDEF)-like protein
VFPDVETDHERPKHLKDREEYVVMSIRTGITRGSEPAHAAYLFRTRVRALGVLYAVGGTLGLVWLTLPRNTGGGEDVFLAAMCGVALLFGGGLAGGAADRLPSGWLHALLVAIQVVIMVAYVADGVPESDVRMFFLWAAPYAAFYYGARVAGAHMAATALLVALAQLLMPPDTHHRAPAVFLMTMGSLLASGVLVGWAARTLRHAEATRRHLALHDPLTGLPNRALLTDRLETALARKDRLAGDVVVLFLDIDQFKVVNDGMGHPVGDALLRQLAERLRAILRAGDTLARFGGDEFVVVCDNVTTVEVLRLGERITSAVGLPFDLDGREVFVSVSVGIAVAGPDEAAETVLQNADVAMYRAKAAGRARSVTFDDAMYRQASARLDTESGLRRALERGELRVYYQPIVDVRTEMPTGFEALVRWAHPERGLVSPLEFIPVAEETGLIVPIGEWVLAQALAQTQAWRTELPGAADLTIAVNLSASQLLAPDLLRAVSATLTSSGIPASAVHLEITESVVMDDVERSIATLDSLRSSGVALAVDDFGTGYSSLSYLKQLPVTTLKIDRSFVDGLGGDGRRDPSIVDAVVSLARALRLGVVAEGVETRGQLGALQRLGADRAQGYLWAKPMPAPDVPAWLALRDASREATGAVAR